MSDEDQLKVLVDRAMFSMAQVHAELYKLSRINDADNIVSLVFRMRDEICFPRLPPSDCEAPEQLEEK